MNQKNTNQLAAHRELTKYCIYEHPSLPRRIVKQGYCWPALIIGPAYLIYRRLWKPLIFFTVALGSIQYFETRTAHPNYLYSDSEAAIVEQIMFGAFVIGSIILGELTNNLWENDLINRGYVKVMDVNARSMDDAIAIIEREKTANQAQV